MADRRKARHNIQARNAATAAVVALASGIRIYSGRQPDAGASTQGALLWGAPLPAFNAPVNGVSSLSGPATGPIFLTGDASWFRVLDHSDDPLFDGSIGERNDGNQYDLVMDSIEFIEGGMFILNTLQHEAVKQGTPDA